MICTGTIPFSAPSISPDGVTDTTEDVRQLGNHVSVILTLGGVFVYMRHDRPVVDGPRASSRDAVLIRAYSRHNAEGPRVDLLTTVADNTDNHFFPSIFAPRLAAVAFTQIGNVLHDAVHRPGKLAVILVVQGHNDE